MKKLLCIFLLLLCNAVALISQEFKVDENGLIYPVDAMEKLGSIVDSLNLRYASCEIKNTFYSSYQTIGTYFSLTGDDASKLRSDIEEEMSLDALLIRYPAIELSRNENLVLNEYVNWRNESVVEIFEINLNSGQGKKINFDRPAGFLVADLTGDYVFSFYDKSDYSEEKIRGFYFPKAFEKQKVKAEYADMIGYSTCLIDTTSAKIKEDATNGDVVLPPNYQELSFAEKEALLDDMRNTKVVGFCSQDGRPRMHAVNIAVLAAETTDWEVFLKAHLDIMNDRFDRVTDGSYAYAQRLTYIKELETLNINIVSLLIGIAMRIENASENHYYGNVSRLGRAISESKYKEEFAEIIVRMASDNDLDLYNRMIMYFLFDNYNYYLTDEELKVENSKILEQLAAEFPKEMK